MIEIEVTIPRTDGTETKVWPLADGFDPNTLPVLERSYIVVALQHALARMTVVPKEQPGLDELYRDKQPDQVLAAMLRHAEQVRKGESRIGTGPGAWEEPPGTWGDADRETEARAHRNDADGLGRFGDEL